MGWGKGATVATIKTRLRIPIKNSKHQTKGILRSTMSNEEVEDGQEDEEQNLPFPLS
jgi:hypothetical protein